MDSMHLEHCDSRYNWHSRMDFCDVPLPAIVTTWSAHRSRKEVSGRAEVWVGFRAHQTL
jgi:hypothetical protein